MTQQEALVEAQRRWGPTAEVGRYWGGRLDYWVDADLDTICVPCGDGDSWEAAFADADRRVKHLDN